MSHPANPNTLGTKMMVSTEEKVTEGNLPLGSDLHREAKARVDLHRITTDICVQKITTKCFT